MRPARLVFAGGTLALALVCEAALTGACSTSSSPPSHDAGREAGRDTGVDARHALDALDASVVSDALAAACMLSATAECQVFSQCNLPGLLGQYGSLGACIERQGSACQARATAPFTGSTAATIESCAHATSNQSCDDFLNLQHPDACTPTGSLAEDASCWTGDQCRTGYCRLTNGSFCGACAAIPAAGTPCGSLYACAPDQVCSPGETCADYVPSAGLPCSATSPCGANLTCVFTEGTGTGICEAAGTAVGVACTTRPEAGPGCGAGLYCNNGGCVAGVGCGGKTCPAATTCLVVEDARACVPRAADGEPCNTRSGPFCLVPSRCIGSAVPASGGLEVTGTCSPLGVGSCR
jgi:hypothetical protein